MKDAAQLRSLLISLLMISSSLAWSIDDANRDPWESLNRKIFAFNESADRYFLAPVARGYQRVTPDPVESGIRNFFSNIDDILVMSHQHVEGIQFDHFLQVNHDHINSTDIVFLHHTFI